MKLATFKISEELIKESLAMPEGTKIYNIIRDEKDPNVYIFTVEHPNFEDLDCRLEIPELCPFIEADYTKKPSTWLTFNWETPNKQIKQT